MKYRLIQMVGGALIRSDFAEENVVDAMAARGFEYDRPCNRKSLRAELQGCPIFKGVAGPMWDGDAVRYEDPASNVALSI